MTDETPAAEELDPGFRAALQELEDYLDGFPEERLEELVLPLGSRWVLVESGLDVARYREEAETFVLAAPLSDRILPGYETQVAWWLARRMQLDVENEPLPPEQPAAVLAAARAALERRAAQVEAAGYPLVAAGFRRVLAASQGEPPDDPLWAALALRIAESVMP